MTETTSTFLQSHNDSLAIQGQWRLTNYHALSQCINQFKLTKKSFSSLDFSALEALDTAGAERLCTLIDPSQLLSLLDQAIGLSPERHALLVTVAQALSQEGSLTSKTKQYALGDYLARLGMATQRFFRELTELMGFIGFCLQTIFLNFFKPKEWRINAIFIQIEETGLNAVPIVCLLTFLVGAVIAFLGATVLETFGATIYTVDLVGFSFMREFAVLLTAILMAGRTASAFTAQLGSMKANEEIDALRAQGLDPMLILVIPRIIAMMITMPMLTFIGMISGIFGGALVCVWTLDISPKLFIDLIYTDISIQHFYVGMSKAPIFAFLIAIIGCLQGFKVSGSAQSVGEHTTAAVVHSIFTVILLDALAALYFMEMGW